jgi:tetratricopeptide (TPR) repeat protein
MKRASLWIFSLLLLLNLCVISWLGYQWHYHYRNRYLDEAEQALIAGDQGSAIRALTSQIRAYPGDRASAARLEELKASYERRYLDDARARLRINDRVGAIAAYQEHIKHYPDDYRGQLELAQVYVDLGSNDAAESLYRGILDNADAKSRIHKSAGRKLFRLIVDWSNTIKKDADKSFEKGDFRAALSGYEKVLNLRARNPALATMTPDRVLAVRAYNNIIARRAFTLWRLGELKDPVRELASDYDPRVFAAEGRGGKVAPAVYNQRRIILSNFFWDYADALFKGKNWKPAADNYDTALKLRNQASHGDADPNTPTLLLDYAISMYRAGDSVTAYRSLVRIKRDFPYHEKARVEELLGEVGKKVPASEKQEVEKSVHSK